MIENLIAVGFNVIVIRDAPEKEKGGLEIPDSVVKKPNTGKIIGVGQDVTDKNVEIGKTAVFHKSSGNSIEIFGTEITILIQNENQQQVLAVY